MSGHPIGSYWREIVSIIEGGLKPDPHRVCSYAEHMASRLQDAGEVKLASRIRQLVRESSKPAGSTFVAQRLPLDLEAQQSLVEEMFPVASPNYPVLPSPTARELQRFVELNRRSGELAREGISPPHNTTLVWIVRLWQNHGLHSNSIRSRTPIACSATGLFTWFVLG